MARDEHRKEDLIAEATGMPDRAEFAIPLVSEPVVVGFRKGTAFSLFFGEEPVYHWNVAGELRRAHAEGRILKAEKGCLIGLQKRRTLGQIQMLRRPLSKEEQDAFIKELQERLDSIRRAMNNGEATLVRQVVADEGTQMMEKTLGWLQTMPTPVRIAKAPNI